MICRRAEMHREVIRRLRVYERITDKDSQDRGSSIAMPSPYYFDYMRI
jgi:hypothetical protein